MSTVEVYRQSVSGVRWGLAAQFAIRVLGFASNLVLARLLTPGDYGTVAMAVTVAGVVSLASDLGFSQALLQCQENIEAHATRIFWLNSVIALVQLALQCLCAPLVAQFYSAPALIGVLRVSSLGYLLGAIGAVSGTMLQKSLRFRAVWIIETISTLTRVVVSMVLAWRGYGYWSIVIAELATKLVAGGLRLALCDWKPGRPSRLGESRELFRFGRLVYAANLLNYFMNNVDFIMLGRLYGPKILGPYYFAYNLVMLFHQILMSIVGTITMPSLAALAKDPTAKRQYLMRTITTLAAYSLPLFGFFAGCSPLIILVLFSSKWAAAVVPFALLSIFAGARGLVAPFGSYSWAAGDAWTPLVWHAIAAPILAVATALCAFKGVNWVAGCAAIVYSLAYSTFALTIAKKHALPIGDLFNAVSRLGAAVIVLSAASAATVHWLLPHNAIALAGMSLVYLVMVLLIWQATAPEALNGVRLVLGRATKSAR